MAPPLEGADNSNCHFLLPIIWPCMVSIQRYIMTFATMTSRRIS